MAYDWPDGWNQTRTEKAIHSWVCDRLNMPKKSVRVTVDSPEIHGTSLEVFRPLTSRPTKAVHDVFGRVSPFADEWLSVGYPAEKLGPATYRLHYLFVRSVER